MSQPSESETTPVARIAAIAALVVAVIGVVFVLTGGDSSREYKLRFQTAGQLVRDDDVQIGGRRVGSVRKIALTDDNQAEITVRVDEPYAPLHVGTRAVIRATSLSGIANRYVAITPGLNSGRELADGATLPADSTTSIVDLDQLFNTLDERTRTGLQRVVQGFSTQYEGKGRQANEAARHFGPTLTASSRLFEQLSRDEGALTSFIVDSSKAVSALVEKRDQLASLVGNTATTAQAIGDENVALGQTLDRLAPTMRKANTSFVNLRATLGDLDDLVDVSLPATRRLAPFLRDLRPLVSAARPTIGDLRRLVTRRGPDNDLIDATRKLPGLARIASPTLQRARKALIAAQPVVETARPYTPELVGWFRDFGQTTAAYDANGHYARIQPIFDAFTVADLPTGSLLTAQPAADRQKGLQSGILTRCPGGATQPAVDGSAPFTDGGKLKCEPKQVPSGP